MKKTQGSKIEIDDLREFLDLKNVTIYLEDGNSYYVVYANEEFNSRFAGSTITFDDSGNGLFDAK